METGNVVPGQRFVTKRDSLALEWVVDSIVTAPFPVPHVRVRRAGDKTTQKLLALSVLKDPRFFRLMESTCPVTPQLRMGPTDV